MWAVLLLHFGTSYIHPDRVPDGEQLWPMDLLKLKVKASRKKEQTVRVSPRSHWENLWRWKVSERDKYSEVKGLKPWLLLG